MPASSTSSPPRSGAALRRTRPVLFRRANASIAFCGLFLFMLFNFASHVVQLPPLEEDRVGNHVFSEAHPSGRGPVGVRGRSVRSSSSGSIPSAAARNLRGGSGGGGGGGGGSTGWDGGRGDLVTIRSVGNGRWLWPSDGDSVMATADEEVNLAAFGAVFEVIDADQALEWVAFRQVVPEGGGGGVGRLLEVGPPPRLRLQLAPADTDLLESHSVQFRIERVHTLGSSLSSLYADESYRGRLLQRSFDVPVELTQSTDVAPFGTLGGATTALHSNPLLDDWTRERQPSYSLVSSSSVNVKSTSDADNYALLFSFSRQTPEAIATSVAAERAAAQEEQAATDHAVARLEDLMRSTVPRGAAASRVKEKRVISYGLYGSDPKYVAGALRNVQLQPTYFPGWTCRFYCDESVPRHARNELKRLGAEVVMMNEHEDAKSNGSEFQENMLRGSIAGMFWRFLVADDPSVDRFIVRDSDSRLNVRDAYAVVDWIRSGRAVHSVRDHPNHDRPLNGGMWGATRGFLQDCPAVVVDYWGAGAGGRGGWWDAWGGAEGEEETKEEEAVEKKPDTMTGLVSAYWNKETYGADLSFLQEVIWPRVKACGKHLSHDAYSCEKYPHAKPFPTKRRRDFQHVGQVFDAADKPRMGDIDGFIRGRGAPVQCRKRDEWRYG